MSKFTKHILSILLCAALCCAVLPAPAFAASGETGQESGQAPAGGMEWTLDELEKAFASLEADSAAETAEPETTGTVVTGGSRLNLRSGGSTDYAVIGQLAPGDQVRVLGEENGWYEVLITEKRGYVCGKYLRVEEAEPSAAAGGSEIGRAHV